ncbi:MAG TPA: YifB family Mg chelatase-like AAA ATPase, partial [Patescibacteria group bacterium]
MISKLYSAALIGLDSELIEVEADLISSYTPGIFIVGLPDKAVEESKERIRSAIKNSRLSLPRKRIVINLAPADLKKQGPAYDLPIAVSILLAQEEIKFNFDYQKCLFVGELALDGRLRNVNGILSVASMAKDRGIKTLFLPKINAAEASLIPGLSIIPLNNLEELILHLNQDKKIKPLTGRKSKLKIDFDNYHYDMAYIKGQEQAKRALEIAAAGGHNLVMSGPPGSGKTLLARTMPSILPTMNLDEALEVTKIYSVAGLLPLSQPLLTSRPFRNPHHSASAVSLVGGGSWPRPGEVSLSHRGVLFLDEFCEFPRSVLENLRQPLEDGFVTISRAAGTSRFPARFILVAA